MKAIIKSAVIVLALSVAVSGATVAYFSDTETSANNTFTAGTLDLSVDGANPLATAKFSVTDMVPGDHKQGVYTLKNTGTIDGYVDLENITVTSQENGCNEPEQSASDTTCGTPGAGEGELQNLVTMALFWDANCDGVINGTESAFYNGLVKDVPSAFALNTALGSGQERCVGVTFDWNSSAQDNIAQGDGMTLALTFELAQTSAQ